MWPEKARAKHSGLEAELGRDDGGIRSVDARDGVGSDGACGGRSRVGTADAGAGRG